MTRLLLTFRIHRFELVVVSLLAAAVLLFAGGLWLRLLAFGLPASCFGNGDAFDPGCAARHLEVNEYMGLASELGTFALIGLLVMPIVVALFLGVALVAQELERGTTALAWAIAPSRRRWLLRKVVPIGLLVAAICLAAGLIANGIQEARDPTIDPDQSLNSVGLRGVVVAFWGLAAFGIALGLGARLGRTLPALLLAGVVTLASAVGATLISDAMLTNERVVVDQSAMMSSHAFAAGKVYDTLVRTPDGTLLGMEEAYRQYGDAIDAGLEGYDPRFRMAYLVNPGQLAPIVEWRLSVLYAAIGLIGIVLTFAVVERRRPG
jgi:hypothetical protein